MAGEPKRRHSSGRKNTRRAAIKLVVNLVTCKNCGKPTKSHIVCANCGFFGSKQSLPLRGKVVGKPEVKVTKA